MKNIYYDVEGDILSITFTEAEGQSHSGIELTDNIVLYFNPQTGQPIKLILLSYRRMLMVSAEQPIPLDGLADLSVDRRQMVLHIISRPPVKNFLDVEDTEEAVPVARLVGIFEPTALEPVF